MFKKMLGLKREVAAPDFATIPQNEVVAGIIIPVLPVEKYPVLFDGMANLLVKASKQFDDPEEWLSNLTAESFIMGVSAILKVCAEELFAFLAMILDVEENVVRKLSLANMIRVINKLLEVNEMAEIKGPLAASLRKNWGKPLRGL